ncbi:DUF11 domain-containing protein, partial [Belliella sp. R4-6]|nr:DUF11 domain-containing protein [Belliella alkalica]
AVRETSYTVTQSDVDSGSVLNTAFVKGENPNPEGEDPEGETEIETPIDNNAGLSISKSDNGSTVTQAGEVITYTLTATNTGNVTIANVTIVDPLTGFEENVGTLAPGQVVVRETSYTVTQSDVDSGSVLNTAFVKGENPNPEGEDPEGETEIETPIDNNAGLSISKSDNGSTVTQAGEVITYTLTATNTGNVTIGNVVITDPLTGFEENVGTLAPGQVVVRETSYTVTQSDVDSGSVLNTAFVKGENPNPEGEDPEGETEIETPIDNNAGLSISKSDNGSTVTQAGEVITYTLTATNTGNVTIGNVVITDPLTGFEENVGTLAPGQVVVRETSYTVTQSDVDSGSVLNTAFVKGENPNPEGEDPEGETEIETPIDNNAGLSISKSDNGSTVTQAGEVIT